MEVISNNFNFDGDKPKQSLLRDDDTYSAIQLSGSKFINSEKYLNYINGDGRVPLGMFFFEENNINENSIEISNNNSIFTRVLRQNLISNGSCKNVKEYYYETGNPSVFTNCLKPDGGWVYLNSQGIATFMSGSNQAIMSIGIEVDDDGETASFVEPRENLIKYFDQYVFPERDNQGYTNYGGYYPYIPISENDLKKYYGAGPNGYFSSTVDTNNTDGEGQWLWAGESDNTFTFPTIATWIQDSKAYSDNRCLIFKSPSSWNIDEMPPATVNQNYNTIPLFMFSFLTGDDSGDLYHNQIADNQYRTLNQAQIITTPLDGISAPLKVRFKMKTLVGNQDGVTFPEVEAGIVLIQSYDLDQGGGGGSTNLYDTLGNTAPQPAYTIADGAFNSKKYYNGSTFYEKKASNFGGLMNFKNTELDTWQEMEFNFTLEDFTISLLSTGAPLTFIIQSGRNFNGTVLMDDFEVFESYDFYPDVDVRKKISTGKYGKGDLTEYYDKELQPEEYKDTTAPLEAQFYFHPRYNSDRIFNVDRTPIYNDFKKGFFYIYDVDWGDGSPKEFTSEPEQIDEEKVVLHNYEKSGIFKVTGNMIRLKGDTDGNPLGLVHSSTFSLYININEGYDDDFNFFNIYGFSTIPYKNTTPVIGGISKESSYYKTIKRQLGFLNDGGYTKINYPDRYSKIKAQKALLNMDDSYLGSPELDELNAYFNDYSQTTFTAGNEEEIINDTPILERTSINNLNLFSNKFRMEYVDFAVYGNDPNNPFGDGYITTRFKIDPQHVYSLATLLGVNPYGGANFQDIPSENYQSYNFFHITDTSLTIEIERNYDGSVTETPLGTDTLNQLPFSIQEDLIYDTNASQGSTRLKYRKTGGNSYLYHASRPITNFLLQEILDGYKTVSYSGASQNIGLYFCKYPLKTTSQIGDADDGNHSVNIQNLDEDELLKMHNTFGESALSVIFKDLGRLSLGWPLSTSEFIVDGNSNIPSENYLVWASRSRWDIAIYLWFIEQYKFLYPQDYMSLTHDYLMNNYIFSGVSRDENSAPLINWLSFDLNFNNPFDLLSYSFQSGGLWNNFNDNQQWPPEGLEITSNLIFNGIKSLAGELGKSLGDCDLTNIKYYNTPKSIWEMFGFEDEDLNQVGKPDEPRYWKNIIPQDYSIYNREGLGEDLIDIYSEQEWLNDSYYPVLPKYGSDGKFIEENFPNNKIPFPIQSSITDEQEKNKNLQINITTNKVETNTFGDSSGNSNIGLVINDYKIKLDEKLTFAKTKNFKNLKTKSKNGAF